MSDDDQWPADAERDLLIGDWHIYQRRGGHRSSTDDVITAWYAAHRCAEAPERYLDLGCGVGSVLLMVCHRLRPQLAVGVEAQPQSVTMARRAVAELPAHELSIDIALADFREHTWGTDYDLITGSPPYFPLGTGVLPNDAQRRACRFETRGGVEAYMASAAAALHARGRFYLVFQTAGVSRVVTAASQQGLHITGQPDFLMRADRQDPFLSVFELAREPAAEIHRFRCAVRSSTGEISDAYQELRRELRENDGSTST